MANATAPHFPSQVGIVQPQISALPDFPDSQGNARFSDRGDAGLAALVPFSTQLQASNAFAYGRGEGMIANVADLRTAGALAAFPLGRTYLGAAASSAGLNFTGVSEGDFFYQTTEQRVFYVKRVNGQLGLFRITDFFNPAVGLTVTQGVRFPRRIKRITTLPDNTASVSLNLDTASHFKLSTNVATTLNFTYTPSEFGPDALSFVVEIDVMAGGSVAFQAGKVFFANDATTITLQAGFKHLLRFTGSRNADNFLVSARVLNALTT